MSENLKEICWINVSWLFIVRHLPMKIYDRIIYPYSHYFVEDAKIQTISHVEFIYRTGSTLHHIKGRNDDLQQTEELLAFYTTNQERILVIKNLRSHLGSCFRAIPIEEAKRLNIQQHNLLFAEKHDYRPVLEKIEKEKKKDKRYKYITYTYFPYRIIDQNVLDLVKTTYNVKRTEQEWFYINFEIHPEKTIEINEYEIICNQDFTLEIKENNQIQRIERIIGDFEFYHKKEMF